MSARKRCRRSTEYAWPGNVRELQNVIERLVVTGRNEIVGLDELPPEIRGPRAVATRPRKERRRTVADELFKRMVEERESFWTAVYPLYMNREITKVNVRDLVGKGLEEARGNYKIVARLFNMESATTRNSSTSCASTSARCRSESTDEGHTVSSSSADCRDACREQLRSRRPKPRPSRRSRRRGRAGATRRRPPPVWPTPPEDYVIGPDDVLGVVFWREKDMSDGRRRAARRQDHVAAHQRHRGGRTHAEQLRGRSSPTRPSKYIEDPTVTVIVKTNQQPQGVHHRRGREAGTVRPDRADQGASVHRDRGRPARSSRRRKKS